MKLQICSVMCLAVLALTSTVRAQVGVEIAGASAALNLSAITATQPASDSGHAFRLEIRNVLSQVLVDMLHGIFGEIRTGLGLPAVPTGSTLDPLASVEAALEDAISTAAGQ